ncbi:16S rRNA (uracil(1498)-N(3))-methyltransferase [Desulfurivibrio dismutans]|uniref:16S rRNA (uracil(1498)-N(3))-methyltransferase n=1 Tax=Desulfurivibrio dismutans TaxID=1398908 RepID=UPI0023DB9F42|nr:16S rRNA (uracil(1498)-N(3))-methyltransferase [Desulfurivibrio alkaliphilus]MDF1615595.1 16S rRNA (uracil(1498)-N(3))-methyltransferase [Desulfurivibrio alkaliphilus]
MRRFFIDPKAVEGQQATLTGGDAHHLQVLRLTAGDQVELFDGRGTVYQARIAHIDPGLARLDLLKAINTPPENLAIHLGQAMLKGKKMDLVVQKCTELGVRSLRPYTSQHTKTPPPGTDKLERWQRIIHESCKQCNQPWPPACHPAQTFHELLATAADVDLRLICWEEPDAPPLSSIVKQFSPPDSIMVLIGPEGGFNRDEIASARQAGFLPVGLGRRILRAETAAIVIIALLQYIFSDLN